MYTILGAGLSGLSIAHQFKKKGIAHIIYEAKSHGGGHIYSEVVDGFTWDEGPHVSFTKHEYVKQYFAQNCNSEFLEYAPDPGNYYKGIHIPHPAQSNMYAIPEPLKTQCIDSLIETRKDTPEGIVPANYQQWIDYAFGEKFAENFAKVYTIKYWTTTPDTLTTNWIGKRIYFPEITDMVESAKGPISKETHYITKVRYPVKGGFYSYIKNVEQGLHIEYQKKLSYISFDKKEILFADNEKVSFDKLISTLPLPYIIENSDAPINIKQSAKKLKCSQVLIINVIVDHPAPVNNHWLYVYDEDFYATRINFTELLAPENGVSGKSGIQVEVYFSEYRKRSESISYIENRVINELIEMKLINSLKQVESYHSKWIEWANVIFDIEREHAQNEVLTWLSTKGLVRESDDLEPMTDWDEKQKTKLGSIILAGRFAQWKYYWTDDCVLRGKFINENL